MPVCVNMETKNDQNLIKMYGSSISSVALNHEAHQADAHEMEGVTETVSKSSLLLNIFTIMA